jgi:Rrf2 family protein
MIPQKAEYALRAITALATTSKRALTTREIATQTGAPAPYLSKVLQELRRAGIVRAARGLHGGFRLHRPVSELSVLEVIQAVDAWPLRNRRNSRHDDDQLAPLHRRLEQVRDMIEDVLSRSHISELLGESTHELAIVQAGS